MEHNNKTGLLEMCQDGLIKPIYETLILGYVIVTRSQTTSEGKPLVKEEDGPYDNGNFSYSSILGMLLYLEGHTRPDIAYDINCCD